MKLRGSYTLRPGDSHENWPHTPASDRGMDVSISCVHARWYEGGYGMVWSWYEGGYGVEAPGTLAQPGGKTRS